MSTKIKDIIKTEATHDDRVLFNLKLWAQYWEKLSEIKLTAYKKELTAIGNTFGLKRKYWGLERDKSFRKRLLKHMRY